MHKVSIFSFYQSNCMVSLRIFKFYSLGLEHQKLDFVAITCTNERVRCVVQVWYNKMEYYDTMVFVSYFRILVSQKETYPK